MVELTNEELIKELEQEAEKIHSSTRVDLPLFSPVHNYLRAKSPTYYKWAISGKSNALHVTGALGFVVSMFLFLFIQFVWPNLFLPKPEEVLAGTNSAVWTSDTDFSAADLTSVIVEGSGDTAYARISDSTFQPQGDGADGALVVSSSFNINTQTNGNGGRTAADGVIWTVNSNVASGQTTISSGTAVPTGFATGDEIIIINLKGTTTDYSNVGLYEFADVQTVNANSIVVDSNLTNSYDGTTQKIVVQRVPNYTDVTINSSQTLTANAWNGTSGGTLVFRSSGTVTNNGNIDVSGLGYRGGNPSTSSSTYAYGGESYNGTGGRGGFSTMNGASGQGGGGGGATQEGSAGTGAAGAVGSGGGGGGTVLWNSGNSSCKSSTAGGGGGGGYGSIGTGGSNGYDASGSTGGNGRDGVSSGYSSLYTQTAGGGGGGGTVGSSNGLNSRVYFGGAGAGGGRSHHDNCSSSGSQSGGAGARSGGIVIIGSNILNNNNQVLSRGNSGSNGFFSFYNTSGAGGGGAGGSIVIFTKNFTNNSTVSVSGGNGGTTGASGGNGGGGRAYLEYGSKSGSNPSPNAYTSATQPYLTTSSIGGSGTGLRYGNPSNNEKYAWKTLTWDGLDLSSTYKVQIQIRSADIWGSGDTGYVNPVTGDSSWYEITANTGSANIASSIYGSAKKTIEVRAQLVGDGGVTPKLNSLTVTYDSLEAPSQEELYLRKSDGITAMQTYYGAEVLNGTYGGHAWTNETSVRLQAASLTCTDCGTSTNIRPEVEVTTMADTDFSTPIFSNIAESGNDYVNITGLSGGEDYQIRVRAIDDEGRVSGWTNYAGDYEVGNPDFSVEQSIPSGTVSIESGDTYSNSTSVTLDLTATDSGGSTFGDNEAWIDMRFSNDGSSWSSWEDFAYTKAWTLESGDGEKTVYAQFKDNAGNISGQLQDTTATNFNEGTKVSVYVNDSGNLSLASALPANTVDNGDGTWTTIVQPDEAASKDACFNRWSSAVNYNDATVHGITYNGGGIGMASLLQFDDINTLPIGSITSANLSLYAYTYYYGDHSQYYQLHRVTSSWSETGVNYTNRPSVAFSYTDRVIDSGLSKWYEFNVTPDAQYFLNNPSLNYGWQYQMDLTQNNYGTYMRSSAYATEEYRPKLTITYSPSSLSDPPYNTTGSFESRAIDSGNASVRYGNLSWAESVPSGASLSMEVRAATTEVGLASESWTSISNGGDLSAFNNKQWIQYKASLANGGDDAITPILSEIFIEINNSINDAVILDVASPASFDLVSPSDSSWQSTADPTFEWEASSDPNGLEKYQLYIDDVLNKDGINPATTSTSPTSSLSAGSYTWYVKVVDNAGNDTQSTSTRTFNVDLAVPNSPTSLGGSAVSETQIDISWVASTDDGEIAGYKVERKCLSCDPVIDWAEIADTSSVNYADLAGLTGGNTYVYRVKAYDQASRESGYSDEKQLSTVDVIAPQQPTGLQVSETIFGDKLDLAFYGGRDGVGIDKYYIYSSDTEFGTYVKVDELDINPDVIDDTSTQRNITISGLVDNKTYWFKASAVDAVPNESIATDPDSGTTPDTTNPELSEGFSIQVTATSSETIDLSWTEATDYSLDDSTYGSAQNGTGFNGWYRVERSENEVDWVDASLGCLNVQTESCTDTGLSALTTYYYRVIAIDKAGSAVDPGNAGNRESFSGTDADNFAKTYTDAVPTAPINLSVSYNSGTENAISFTGSTSSLVGGTQGYELDYYQVYRFQGAEQAGDGATTNEQLADWITKNSATQVGGDINVISQASGSRSGSDYEYVDDSSYNLTDSSLINANTYKYKVVAYDTTPGSNVPPGPFASPMSSTYTVTTPDTEIPAEYNSDSVAVETQVIYGPTESMPRIVISWSRVPEILRSTTSTVSTDGDSTITVSSGTGAQLVSGQFIRINSEILKITNIATDTLTVFRAQAGTTQASHNSGDSISTLDFTKYRLFKDSGAGYQEIQVDTFTSPELNYYVDGDIAASTTYKYKVTIVDTASTFKGYKNNQPNQIIQVSNNESSGKETGEIDTESVDKVAPTIIGDNVSVTPGVSTALITWDTNEVATTTVYYGKSDGSYTEKAGTITSSGGSEVLVASDHEATITGLTPGDTYYYKVESKDASGNTISKTGSFETSSFTASNVVPEATSSSVTINWDTNINGSSYIEFKKSGSSDAYKIEGSSDLTKEHEVVIKNLSSGFYSYNVKSYDQAGNLASQSLLQFEIPTADAGAFGTPQAAKVEEKEITATSAKITWTSTLATTSWVDYSKTSGVYNNSTGNDESTLNHIVTIENLTPDTTYYYRIRGVDASGIEYVSEEYRFKALAQPIISNIKVTKVGPYDASIVFTTNIDTQSGINYGKDTGYGKRVQSQDFVKTHQLALIELDDNSTYHFQVDVKDESGNSISSVDQVFKTPLDKTAPVISDVKLSPLSGSDDDKRGVIITWTTDKPATSQVAYSSGVIVGSYNLKTPKEDNLSKAHTVVINNLEPGTTYHFQLLSEDKRGNVGESPDYTMITQDAQESILELILKTLEDTFSWVGKIGDFFGNTFSELFTVN